MKNTLRKWLPLVGIFSGALAFAASSSDSSYDSGSNRNNNKQQMVTQITPPAMPTVDNGVGFSIFADYILWDARTDVDFARSGFAFTNSSTLAQGKTYSPGFKYNSGFKVGANAELGFDNWDLEAQYIWLRPGYKRTTIANGTYAATTLNPIWMSAPSNTRMVGGFGEWKLGFNVIQLNLGRNYMLSQNLSMRTYYGVRGAWDTQTNNTNYNFNNSANSTTTYNVWQKQDWWGVGFQTGMDTAWMFDENWSIYANFGTSLLWGRTRNQVAVKDTTANPDAYSERWADTGYGVQPTFDLEMGFRWVMTFDDNSYAFLVQAGWEQQVWLSHSKFATNTQDGNSNLNLQGFNLRARFYF